MKCVGVQFGWQDGGGGHQADRLAHRVRMLCPLSAVLGIVTALCLLQDGASGARASHFDAHLPALV